jgi:intraflagellar transport protein 43
MASNDFDLSLSPARKPAVAKGRRAALSSAATNNAFLDDAETFMAEASLQQRPVSGDLFLDEDSADKRPKQGRRNVGGWADESTRAKTAKSVRMMEPQGGIGSDDDDMPIIPDLDDVRDEDMAFTVADAPSVAVNRVATYKELDNDLLKHVAFATLDDIDLKLLTKRMAPEAALQEPDVTWSWDVIFAEVSGELQKEWEPEEDGDVDSNGNNSKPSSAEKGERVGPSKERPYTAFNRFPV